MGCSILLTSLREPSLSRKLARAIFSSISLGPLSLLCRIPREALQAFRQAPHEVPRVWFVDYRQSARYHEAPPRATSLSRLVVLYVDVESDLGETLGGVWGTRGHMGVVSENAKGSRNLESWRRSRNPRRPTNAAVPSINSSCMRLANFLQPECFGRLHVGRFKSRRRLCLLFIHPGAPNLISLRSAGTMPA